MVTLPISPALGRNPAGGGSTVPGLRAVSYSLGGITGVAGSTHRGCCGQTVERSAGIPFNSPERDTVCGLRFVTFR